MAKSDSSSDSLGNDTLGHLEDAKKGKARSFLLICKGSEVVYLKAGKKPVKPAEAAEAKKLGFKGTFTMA